MFLNFLLAGEYWKLDKNKFSLAGLGGPPSKALVCVRSLAVIAGSNPARRMGVCCEYCVMPGKGLHDGPITDPEECYRLWCV